MGQETAMRRNGKRESNVIVERGAYGYHVETVLPMPFDPCRSVKSVVSSFPSRLILLRAFRALRGET
jgi:hypothetical protein